MRIKVNMDKAALKKIANAQIEALELTAEAVKTDAIASNVMPFASGALQNESTTIDTSKKRSGYVAISSNTPYARRLYFHPEYKFNKDNNPNAQGKWWTDWITGERKPFVRKAYAKFFKQKSGV